MNNNITNQENNDFYLFFFAFKYITIYNLFHEKKKFSNIIFE